MASKRKRRLPRVEERQRATRRQLVAAARRLFGRRGVFDVPVEDLAREAGVGKGTVYLYFADRDSLLGAALEDSLEEVERWIDERVVDREGGPERARRIALAYLEFFRRHRDTTKLLLQVRGLILPPARHRELVRPIQRHLSLLEGRLVDRPRSSRPAAEPLAMLIFGTALGVASMSVMGRPRGTWVRELERGLADSVRVMAQRTAGSARLAD
jgi:AcrR family transcriptional regulator